jgi:CO/xanthine dehydrogenase Mo-binding subunit
MDEVAAALNLDPIEFRLKHLKAPRDIAVIKAAAEKAGWQTRPSPRRGQTGNVVSGRGMAYSQRNGTLVAIVAEVEIDRTTGKIWARKFTVAHDCGLVINPEGLKHTIEGNMCRHSRTLWEEVKFDQKNVTSVDWMTYPILDITETPETIDIVIIAGPRSRRRAPASRRSARSRPIANAIFDATAHPPRAVLARRVKGALA